MNNKKVSIIVPIYNEEKYINRCLESLTKQTYNNIEIILVDDGSTDNSEKICKEYCKKDSRFIYFYKEHTGVSETRNLGLENAKGTYISFVDSDDYVRENFISDMVLNIEKNNVDMACTSYNDKIRDGKEVLKKNDFLKVLFGMNASIYGYQGYVWNKLFKKQVIERNNIKFDKDIYYNEDRLFVFNYLQCIKNDIGMGNEQQYYHQINENSVTNLPYNERMNTEFLAFEKMIKNLNKENNDIQKWIEREMFINSCIRYRKHKEKFFCKYAEYKTLIKLLFKYKYGLKEKLRLIKQYVKYLLTRLGNKEENIN